MTKKPQREGTRFIEIDGRRWAVYPVIEGQGWDQELAIRRENWLSFETQGERRFISPLPLDWASWSDERVRAELAKAPRSKRRSFGS